MTYDAGRREMYGLFPIQRSAIARIRLGAVLTQMTYGSLPSPTSPCVCAWGPLFAGPPRGAAALELLHRERILRVIGRARAPGLFGRDGLCWGSVRVRMNYSGLLMRVRRCED